MAASVSDVPCKPMRNMVDTPSYEITAKAYCRAKSFAKKCFLWRASDFTHFSQHRHALAITISLIWACGIHYFIACLLPGKMTNSLCFFGEKSDWKTQSFNSAFPNLSHFPFPFVAQGKDTSCWPWRLCQALDISNLSHAWMRTNL